VFPPPLEGTRHVVGRADLGSVPPGGGPVTVRLISENGAPIGIDSLVLTRH
jgi:hypothetical protein